MSKRKNPREGKSFDEYLAEKLKDPEFKKEWEKLCAEDIQKCDTEVNSDEY